MASPRVLFIGHGAERTGPPLHLLRLVRWMAEAGHPRPTVLLARHGDLVEQYREVAEVVVATRGSEPLEPVAAGLRRIGRAEWGESVGRRWLEARLRGIDAHDLIYVNSASPANVRVLRALGERDEPTVVHIHELGIGLSHNLDADDRALLFGRADCFAAVCQAVADELVKGHGIHPAKITLSPGFIPDEPATSSPPDAATGLELRRSLGIGPDAYVLVTAALPDWRKAPDVALRVAWSLRRTRPDIDLQLVWVGGDPGNEDGWRARHEAAQLGLADRFHLLPHRPDPGVVLGAADVYLSTAREDAFPLACLEAAALGRPIVCFTNGGAQELVAGDGGGRCPYPDTDAMAALLADLHDDPARRLAAGAAVQTRVRRDFVASTVAPRLWEDIVLPTAAIRR